MTYSLVIFFCYSVSIIYPCLFALFQGKSVVDLCKPELVAKLEILKLISIQTKMNAKSAWKSSGEDSETKQNTTSQIFKRSVFMHAVSTIQIFLFHSLPKTSLFYMEEDVCNMEGSYNMGS